jgi:hypothetical protein
MMNKVVTSMCQHAATELGRHMKRIATVTVCTALSLALSQALVAQIPL